MFLAQPKGGLVLVGSCQKQLSFSKSGCGYVRYTQTHWSITWGPLCVTRDHTTLHVLPLGRGHLRVSGRGLCVSHSQKILCFPLLALSLFLCRFRGCPFCCCWRVTRNGSEWFSEVTVSVMQVMLEGPSVPSGGVTAPCPSPALVTPHGWLPLPFLLPCSAPGFVVLQEGRATSSDSSPLVSSPSVVSEQ